MSRTLRHLSRAAGSEAAAGFTLTELMMVMTVIGILAVMALPSYDRFIKDQRVKAAVSEVFATLILARSEAIKRGADIVVTPANPANWGAGWDVAVSGGNPPLKVQEVIAGVTVAGPATLTYRRDGRITAGATQFVMSAPDDDSITKRCVRLDPSGRPNIKIGC